MSRRVRSLGAAILALSLVFSVPTASAAVMERDRGLSPRFFQRVVRTIQKVLKPLAPVVQDDQDDQAKPNPPIP